MTAQSNSDHVDLLHVDWVAPGVRRLTMADPRRRNALSEAMMAALATALDAAADDLAVRVVVLAAAGPVFCAGHDLKEMTAARQESDAGRARFAQLLKRCSALMRSIMANPKPVIAAVDGLATAAGCQLVASCDLAYAGPNAGFCTPGVHIGLFCSTPMVALSRNVATKHAMEMLLTGDVVPAARAAEIGLVNADVTAQPLADHVRDVAQKIAAKSPATLATGKIAFYQQREMAVADAYDYAVGVMVENMLHCDAVEGINAFIDKRPPHWQSDER